MRITYVGHATLLIELGGVRILTDPNFDPRLGWILPRVSKPGLAVHELPTLDAILLTHAHADHLSFTTLDQLRSDAPLIAPPPVAKWLLRLGYRHARALPPDRSTSIGAVTIHAAAAAHRGNRYGFDRWRSAANMYLLDSNAESCFFAGDTALRADTHHLVESRISARKRRLDIAMLPIGYAPWWKPGFRRGHLTHDDALTLFERLGARALIPYHWGTFRHVTATAHDAIDRLRRVLHTHPMRGAVRILEPGESLDLAPDDGAAGD